MIYTCLCVNYVYVKTLKADTKSINFGIPNRGRIISNVMLKRDLQIHHPTTHRVATLLLLMGLGCGVFANDAAGAEIFAIEATKFLELQQENYNSMLTGQKRLKRACSVPLTRPQGSPRNIPDLSPLRQELVAESGRFRERASKRYSSAKREETLECRNPVGKVLELFGAKSGCAEAGDRVAAAQTVLKIAADWESLLAAQLQVLDDAATLERQACLSPGFTSKLTRAYTDSVRPQGTPLGTLFDRWTSAQ